MGGAPAFARLVSPTDIGTLHVRNRVMLTTHNPKMSEDRYLAYLEERVAGGVGLVGIPILHENVSSALDILADGLDPGERLLVVGGLNDHIAPPRPPSSWPTRGSRSCSAPNAST